MVRWMILDRALNAVLSIEFLRWLTREAKR